MVHDGRPGFFSWLLAHLLAKVDTLCDVKSHLQSGLRVVMSGVQEISKGLMHFNESTINFRLTCFSLRL